MKVLNKALLIAGVAAISSQAQAQITLAPKNDSTFTLKFAGRTNMDLGTYLATDSAADNGAAVNDTRLCFVANWDNWETKVEVCYANKAISFRDVYIRYNFSKNNKLTIGNQFMPYGTKPAGLNYKFVEDGSVDYALCSARKMGINYLYTTDPLNLTAGIYSDGNVDAKGINKGYNLAAQAIWRPICDESTILHFGGAFIHTVSPAKVSYSGIVPTTIETRKVISTTEGDADNVERWEASLLFIHTKLLLEARFLGSNVKSDAFVDDSYYGAWGQVSYQILGSQQKYNKATGLASNSAAGTLEVLARYDYLDLKSFGKQNDFQIGVNYFFSKHLNLKFNYVYVDQDIVDRDPYHLVQARLQFSF
ncbi:MAG: hypothetical protein IKQ46_12890 [Bacteroidales bacterium]|nr:hypothetical protein [Bacteroidales bacterium]